MEFEVQEKKKIPVKFEGKVYDLRKPTIGESRDFAESQEGLGDKQSVAQIDNVIKYLAGLGLPAKVAKSMDGDQLMALLGHLGGKKNSPS